MKSYLMLFLIILCFPFAAASDELSPEQSVQEITA